MVHSTRNSLWGQLTSYATAIDDAMIPIPSDACISLVLKVLCSVAKGASLLHNQLTITSMSSSKHPEAQCGSDCFAAKLQTGDRKGTYFDLDLPLSGKIQTYFTAPGGASKEEAEEKKYDKIILWMADIFGPYYNNNCLLMDWHASQGESAWVTRYARECG